MEPVAVHTQEDLEECLAIRKEVFVMEQNVSPEEEIDEFDASPEACCHVLLRTDSGETVGTGRWRPYNPQGTAKLQRIAIRKEQRGKGLGSVLLLAMERQARAAGMEYAVLDAQCHAEAFYQKLGYETISAEPFYDAGILHVKMLKALMSEH